MEKDLTPLADAKQEYEEDSLDLVVDFEIEELESRLAFAATPPAGGCSNTSSTSSTSGISTTSTPTWS